MLSSENSPLLMIVPPLVLILLLVVLLVVPGGHQFGQLPRLHRHLQSLHVSVAPTTVSQSVSKCRIILTTQPQSSTLIGRDHSRYSALIGPDLCIRTLDTRICMERKYC